MLDCKVWSFYHFLECSLPLIADMTWSSDCPAKQGGRGPSNKLAFLNLITVNTITIKLRRQVFAEPQITHGQNRIGVRIKNVLINKARKYVLSF